MVEPMSPNLDSQSSPPSAGNIFSLPDELLLIIFNRDEDDSRHGDHDEYYRYGAAIALVCRRFNRVITQLLYKTLKVSVKIDHPFWSPFGNPGFLDFTPFRPPGIILDSSNISREATEALHRTLDLEPKFRKHCRVLKMNVGRKFCGWIRHQDSTISMDLVTWLTKTTSCHLSFEDDSKRPSQSDSDHFWQLVETAAKNMVHLNKMSIAFTKTESIFWPVKTRYQGFDLVHISHLLDKARSLKDLTLDTLSFVRGPLPPGIIKERSSSLTTLSMTDFYETPGKLSQFLRVPAALKSLTLELLFPNGTRSFERMWSMSTVHSMISYHKSTLRTLRFHTKYSTPAIVSTMFRDGEERELNAGLRTLRAFDLCEFENLEELELSSVNMAADLKEGYMNQANILAPSLKRFTWFLPGIYFGPDELDWLRRLVSVAWSKKSRLQEIRIRAGASFNDSDDPLLWNSRNGRYSYAYLNRVIEDAQTAGIRIVCNILTESTRSGVTSRRL